MTELELCTAAAPARLVSSHLLRWGRPFRFGGGCLVSDNTFNGFLSHLLSIGGRYTPERLNNSYQDDQPEFPIRLVLPTYMGCKVTDSLSILSLRYGESFDGGCHILRIDVFPPSSVQFVKNASSLSGAQFRNEACAMFGAFIYPVGEVARPAAPRAWPNPDPDQLDARTRAQSEKRSAPKVPAVIAQGWEQVSVACHCRGKLAPSDTPVAGSGVFRKGPRRYAHLGERCRSCGLYRPKQEPKA